MSSSPAPSSEIWPAISGDSLDLSPLPPFPPSAPPPPPIPPKFARGRERTLREFLRAFRWGAEGPEVVWDGEEERGIYSHLLNGRRNGAARSEVASPRCSPPPFPHPALCLIARPELLSTAPSNSPDARRLLPTLQSSTHVNPCDPCPRIGFITSAPGSQGEVTTPARPATDATTVHAQAVHTSTSYACMSHPAKRPSRVLRFTYIVHHALPCSLTVLLRRGRTREGDLTRGLCPPSVCQQRYPRSRRLCGLIPSFCDSEAPVIVPGALKA